MQLVKDGDTIRVHYHGKLQNGETFDSSKGREPLEFTVGSGQVIKGFDEGVKGMQPGDKKTVEIPADDAYGHKDETAIFEFPIEQLPADIIPEPGLQLVMADDGGQSFPVKVLEVKNEVVVFDANHNLAGEDLIFDLELVEIVPTSKIIMP